MRLKETYGASEIHHRWESVYRGNPVQDKFNNQLLDRLMGCLNLRPGALVLDAGCGTGDHAVRFARRGYQCVGVDISETVLKEAEKNILRKGLNSKISLVCQALEDLSLADDKFDVVHCRGVLMHIPHWERALEHLCRVLKPGGRIVIMEGNLTSLETAVVRFVRLIRTNESKMIRTPAGLEFWSEERAGPFVVRTANMAYLVKHLCINYITTTNIMSTEFWDINRFASGALRNTIIRFNRLWFSLRLPAFLSSGNAIIGEKRLRF